MATKESLKAMVDQLPERVLADVQRMLLTLLRAGQDPR